MFIDEIRVQHFRNLHTMHLRFSRGFNVLHGDNGQGKSNILEALFFLAYLKGFRSTKISDLLHYDQTQCKLQATLTHEASQIHLDLHLENKNRRILVDDSPIARIGDYLGLVRLSLFEPQDVALLQASPAARRIALDRMLFYHKPLILQDLEQYQKVLRAKANILRNEHCDLALLDVYDEQLSHYAERIILSRLNYLAHLNPLLQSTFKILFDESFDLRLIYNSPCFPQELVFGEQNQYTNDFWQVYHKNMRRMRNNERFRHMVLAGPHRDDWSILINNKYAKTYASQGQQRAILLSLKMAALLYLQQSQHISPILLLDDVSSELDPTRNRKLFDFLSHLKSQVFLTTTSLSYFPFQGAMQSYCVKQGQIIADTEATHS